MTRIPLSSERIFAAALGVADTLGLESLSMRKVAEHLGVEAMSLYNHVANKEAILDGIVDLVFREIELPQPGDPWQEALRRRAASAHQVLHRHPWAAALMDSRANPGMATMRHHNAVIGCLRGAGFTIAMTAHAISLIDGYLYGFSLQQRALPFETEAEVASIAANILAHFPAAEFPHLAEMITDHALTPGYDYEKEFGFGLDLILDGLQRLLAAQPDQRVN